MSKSAFPGPFSEDALLCFDDHQGMSLLEYYVGQALIGVMGHTAMVGAKQKDIIQMTFELAEAMVKEAENHGN